MTNEKRFKTVRERLEKFKNFCNKQKCEICCFKECDSESECALKWLDLEYKEELKPCPFCGGTPVMADNVETMRSLSYFVWCACGARFASALSVSAAAEMWNRRVK